MKDMAVIIKHSEDVHDYDYRYLIGKILFVGTKSECEEVMSNQLDKDQYVMIDLIVGQYLYNIEVLT